MRVAYGVVCVAVLVGSDAHAMFKECSSPNVPVERLLKNMQAYIASHPDDPMGPYTLGRMNYYAFSARLSELNGGSSCGVSPGDAQHLPSATWGWAGGPHHASPAEMEQYVSDAFHQLHLALAKQPDNALFWNTLASLLEEASSFASHMNASGGMPPEDVPATLAPADVEAIRRVIASAVSDVGELVRVPKTPQDPDGCTTGALLWQRLKEKADPVLGQILQRCWTARALAAYSKAFELAYPADSKKEYIGLIDKRVSMEAGQAIIRLLKARTQSTPEDAARIEDLGKKLDRMSLVQGPVTPIVMALNGPHSLAELLSLSAVLFDLDGSGAHRKWSWVKPTTGLLVWDPQQTGRITSGHQLIGAMAFQMFWRTGYAALDALDDNRDGVLTGDELRGLALWFDRDSNGVSDRDEVISVEQLGIVGIAVSASGYVGDVAMSTRGVWLRDGRVLPTYDWIATPLAPQPTIAARTW